MKKYMPISSLEVPRFAEVKTYMRLPNVRTNKDVDYVIVGVPFDTASTYRTGARFGPSSIRDISSLIKPYNAYQKVNVVEKLSGVDYGDISVVPGDIMETYSRIEKEITTIVKEDVIPICMGGDHSITLGELRALAKKHGPLALVHFDAHFDTVDSYFGLKYNHGTVFKRAVEEGLIDTSKSIQVGMRGTFYSEEDLTASEVLGFEVITGEELKEIGIDKAIERINKRVGDSKAFLSFDIDFIDPAFAPGTGTIEVNGFTGGEALKLVREVKGLDFVGFDLVEVLPASDVSEITACLASNIIFEFISIIALNKPVE